MKKILSLSGFTLVELMVSIAIVGALAALAIPNYLSYTAKGRQAEAKIDLSNIFAAEMNFAVSSGFYSACLTQLGYIPNIGDARYYTHGFSYQQATNTDCGSSFNLYCATYVLPATTCGPPQTLPASGNSLLTTTPNIYSANALANTSMAWPIDASLIYSSLLGNTFTAAATGSISPLSTSYSIWTIDQNKSLQNKQPGM